MGARPNLEQFEGQISTASVSWHRRSIKTETKIRTRLQRYGSNKWFHWRFFAEYFIRSPVPELRFPSNFPPALVLC